MKLKIQDFNFRKASLALLEHCQTVIRTYQAAGYKLTLRQLYYRLVAADLIPNRVEQYSALGDLINNARLAGLIDWDAIEDRTRGIAALSHWDNPSDIISGAAQGFRVDKWEGQLYAPVVAYEKDALAGVFGRVAGELDIPHLSTRGYSSVTALYEVARYFTALRQQGRLPIILHFADHDPSGVDMSRDFEERVDSLYSALCGYYRVRYIRPEFKRVALNMEQVEQYNPPPNPAKTTDSRFAAYADLYGFESWELDAIEPANLADLVRTEIYSVRDADRFAEREAVERDGRRTLEFVSRHWDEVSDYADRLRLDLDEDEEDEEEDGGILADLDRWDEDEDGDGDGDGDANED